MKEIIYSNKLYLSLNEFCREGNLLIHSIENHKLSANYS